MGLALAWLLAGIVPDSLWLISARALTDSCRPDEATILAALAFLLALVLVRERERMRPSVRSHVVRTASVEPMHYSNRGPDRHRCLTVT